MITTTTMMMMIISYDAVLAILTFYFNSICHEYIDNDDNDGDKLRCYGTTSDQPGINTK